MPSDFIRADLIRLHPIIGLNIILHVETQEPYTDVRLDFGSEIRTLNVN